MSEQHAERMRIGSLFSGIGGFELGLEWAGVGRTVWQVERDEFCKGVLARHWPDAQRFDDVRAVGSSTLTPVDLLCGGFPCQDVSSAGKGAGLAGDRSGLWSEYARIVDEMQPEWVVVENVLSGASRWLDAVVCDLEKLGYACLPVPLSAADVGAPHLRKRIFVVARLTDAKLSRRETLPIEVAYSDGVRELRPQGRKQEIGGRFGNGNWWSLEPDVGRVAHGIPARSHRLKSLGNAVVPQCAEAIGHIIRELANREAVKR